jgi:hypothetical protein
MRRPNKRMIIIKMKFNLFKKRIYKMKWKKYIKIKIKIKFNLKIKIKVKVKLKMIWFNKRIMI